MSEYSQLRDAAREALRLLGPKAPRCSGCEYEWSEAIKALEAGLGGTYKELILPTEYLPEANALFVAHSRNEEANWRFAGSIWACITADEVIVVARHYAGGKAQLAEDQAAFLFIDDYSFQKLSQPVQVAIRNNKGFL